MGGGRIFADDITFTIGESSGKFHHGDSGWYESTSPTMSGWECEKNGVKLVLASSADVWFANTSTDSNYGKSKFPLLVNMTNDDKVTGPNLRVVKGEKVIKKVKVTLYNKYRGAVLNNHNSFTVSIGAQSLTVDCGKLLVHHPASGSKTFNEKPYTDFSPTQVLSVSMSRTATSLFERDRIGGTLVSPVYEDINAYMKVEVTVGDVPQLVEYQIYEIDAEGNEVPKEKEQMGEKPWSDASKYFIAQAEQIVGTAPELPLELRRLGCVYGYDKTSIEMTASPTTEPFKVKAFYSVDYSQIPFYFSTSANEYRYFLQNGEGLLVKDFNGNLATVDEVNANPNIALTFSFQGDPYSFKMYRVKGTGAGTPLGVTCTKYNGEKIETNITDEQSYSNWELYGCKWATTPTAANQAIADQSFSVNLQYDDTRFENFNPIHLYFYKDDNGVIPEIPAANSSVDANARWGLTTTSYNGDYEAGFMLRAYERPENITVNYVVYDEQGNEIVASRYTTKDVYPGDVIVLPPDKQQPYYTYSYFTTYAPATKEFSNPISVCPDGWTKAGSPYTVYVKAVFEGPFIVSPDVSGNDHWYYVKVNGKLLSARGHYPYPLEENTAENPATLSPMHLWKFCHNTDGTIRLVNRWYDQAFNNGKAYSLYNINGDFAGNAAYYSGFAGAMMMGDTEGEAAGYSKDWELVEVTRNIFGLKSVGKSMNLCDNGNMLRYTDKAANVEDISRITVEEKTIGGAATNVATTIGTPHLSDYVASANENAGNPFSFKTAQSGGDVAALENILIDPALYERMAQGYYQIHVDDKDAKTVFLQVRSNAVSNQELETRDVMTDQRIRAWLTTVKSPATTDATAVFNFKTADAAGTLPVASGRLSAEDYSVNPTTAVAVSAYTELKSQFDACTATIYPMGLGQVALQADRSSVTGYESTDMLISYKETYVGSGEKRLGLESAYLTPTPFKIQKVSTLGVKMTQVGGSGPSYGSVYESFDMEIPSDIGVYRCTEINEDLQQVTLETMTLTNNVLPANTPAVLVKKDATASETRDFSIVGTIPTAAANAQDNKFVGTHFAFIVPKVDNDEQVTVDDALVENPNYYPKEEHHKIRTFGSGGGRKAGFYPMTSTKHVMLPANKAYLDKRGESKDEKVSAKAIGLMLVFLDVTTAIDGTEELTVSSVMTGDGAVAAPEVYDLQGRRVLHPQRGIYVVNGRKVVFK